MFLILYVDDILLAGNNFEMIKATKKWLLYVCDMKDVAKARYALGVEIIWSHPKKYISKGSWNDFWCIILNLWKL